MRREVRLSGRFIDMRPLEQVDARLTFEWRQSARAKLLNQGAGSVEEQAAWIRSRPTSEHNFVITLKDERPIGMLSLTGIDPVNRHGEPGRFLIGDEEAARGTPAAVEAMKLLYDFAFDEIGLVRVFGTVASDNARMVKWQKYLGMCEEGRLRQHYFINGRFQDAIILGLLVEEYRDRMRPKMDALIALAEAQPAAQSIQERQE